jgi:hypothetical protein
MNQSPFGDVFSICFIIPQMAVLGKRQAPKIRLDSGGLFCYNGTIKHGKGADFP